MNGTGRRLASVPENENLKLAGDFFFGKILGRSKMAASGVVDQNVEMTSFRKLGVECLVNRTRITQVEAHGMELRHLGKSFQIA